MKFFSVLSLTMLCFSAAMQAASDSGATIYSRQAEQVMPYKAKDYSALLGMKGFNDDLLKMHFKLYEGYVNNFNLLAAEIAALTAQGKDRTYDFGALKRRMAWEFDGMRLHELYFDNLRGNPKMAPDPSLLQEIISDFGSFEAWKKDFISTGMMRGIGWAVLCRDKSSGRLFNVWINEHDLGHFATAAPLLVLDVFEHAYITQYGLNRELYILAFFDNLNWDVVNTRWKDSIRVDTAR